ncbi:hypothetical protein PHLCEN_2v4302 [Hermanssonia centrifuga]|uniref:DUF6535 domain-containing protein n=1 Tax=Hermanssonia centrifuga TaxID=98765 RepID=A0A2R6PVQ4_9APHY|nr:hypothetical protein PHLCEN_2v4302 [Hermanssonia centrifuga]
MSAHSSASVKCPRLGLLMIKDLATTMTGRTAPHPFKLYDENRRDLARCSCPSLSGDTRLAFSLQRIRKYFAGLFSAVLTAFVVQSYQLLQEDNTQISAQLLYRISSQINSFESIFPFLNSTTSFSSSPSPFQPSASARWINVLWFLSLVFSLASALLGIFAKQWIREYLQWAQVAASPRENVLVRQLRIEAWDDWKVPTGISAIPALLELAVVLFVVGLVVLLWTLDAVVAITITIVTVVLLLAVCAVTVLPSIFHRCPYKSPTGWACVIIYDALIWTFRYTWTLAAGWLSSIFSRVGRHPIESIPCFHQFQSWRHRDLSIDKLNSREISDFADIGVSERDSLWVDPKRLIQDICEVSALTRALVWVRKGSEDVQLLKHVAKSAETLHGEKINGDERYYSFLYVMRKVRSDNARRLQPLASILDDLRSKAFRPVGDLHGDTYMFRGGVFHDATEYLVPGLDSSMSSAHLWVLGYLLLGDTLASVTRVHYEKYVVLMSLLRSSGLLWLDRPFHAECSMQLAKLYGDMASSVKHQEFRVSGIHAMILEMLCSIGNVSMDGETRLLSVSGPRTFGFMQNEVSIATQTFESDPDYSDEDARHQFVMMADLVLRSLNRGYAPINKRRILLQYMAEAARKSLEKRYNNCGCYHDLPWISSLLSCKNLVLRRLLPAKQLWSLLDVLEESMLKKDRYGRPLRLITGKQVNEEFANLKKRVEELNPRLKEYPRIVQERQ